MGQSIPEIGDIKHSYTGFLSSSSCCWGASYNELSSEGNPHRPTATSLSRSLPLYQHARANAEFSPFIFHAQEDFSLFLSCDSLGRDSSVAARRRRAASADCRIE